MQSKFATYVDTLTERGVQRLLLKCQIKPAYLPQLKGGWRLPSRKLAYKIAQHSKDQVPVDSWPVAVRLPETRRPRKAA